MNLLVAEVLYLPGVPSSDVRGNTTELRRRSGSLVSAGQLLSAGLEVVVPAQPATVASVEVLDNVGQVEGLQRVGNTVTVARSAVLASLEVDVGDQVGERVGLDEEGKGRVGVCLNDRGDR